MSPLERGRRPVLPLLLAGVIACTPALAAETPRSKLDAVEKALADARARQAELARQADALAVELTALRESEVAAAKAAQTHEAALTDLEGKLAQLGAEAQAKTAALARQRASQARLLTALAGLAASPPEGLLLTPGTPVDVMRGALLMGAAVPPLERRAQGLRVQLAALADLRAQIADAQAQHRAQSQALAGEQARIAGLIDRKATLRRQALAGAADSDQRQQQLGARAANLRELIERLDAEQRRQAAQREAEAKKAAQQAAAAARAGMATKPPAETLATVTAPPPVRVDPTKPRHIRPFSEARGAMVFPATGTLMRHFGETDEQGVASKGLAVETRPGAVVVAPFDGKVEFAGPFRGYGHILIIAHGDGYHSLLAGLDRVDCGVGQWLVAGEPVGVMPGAGQPRLYFELRHNNQPINPLPWLSTRVEKVNG